jgi:type I restriction-modification system DNA methylase subunit
MTREEAKAIINTLVERFREHRKDYHLADYNEAKTRQDFINPFFEALGWDIDNDKGASEAYREVIYEDKVVVKGKAKAPDYGFRLAGSGNKRLFYVEAKKPAIPLKTNKEAAYQLRRYGSSAQAFVSILTNFEDFIVYDCSKVPNLNDNSTVARLKHISFEDYIKEFDFIYDIFSHEAVTKGRFDKFVQSSATKKGTDTLDKKFVESLDKWRKYLATSIALNNRKIDDEELNFAVQLTIDRLIFLRFCEDRAVEPYGQLQKAISKGDAYKNLFDLFKHADDKYNSGLFDFKKDAITPRLKIDNKVIRFVIDEMYYPLCNFEFAVMPVEILGNAYEQFLGKVIRITPARGVKIEEKPEVRKAGGVFYTPQYVVEYIVRNTLGKLVEGKTPEEVEKIKIVDPACGSGSFLLGASQYLLDWHLDYYFKENIKLTKIIEDKANALKEKNKAIKDRGALPLTPDGKLTTKIKKQIIVNNIYGVDLDANAVEVTKLSLLLKCMEGETEASVKTITLNLNDRVLPNLDNNIKNGNSLIDTDFYDNEFDLGYEQKIKPFSWKKGFPEVFKQNGFDIVIGNPPYGATFTKHETKYFTEQYKLQNYQLDSYFLFIEKSLNILQPKALLGFIIPNTWLLNLKTSKIRQHLFSKTEIANIVHYQNPVFEQAVVDTEIMIFRNSTPSKTHNIEVEIFDKKNERTERKINQQNWIDANGEPVNILDTEKTRSIKGKFSKLPILDVLCKITQGTKPFQVGKGVPKQTQKIVDEKTFVSERKIDKFFKPLLRGSLMNRYQINWNNNYWIKFGDWLAEPRYSAGYDAKEKIIIRQTGDYLNATLDTKQFIVRDNLYTITPNSKEINLRYILGLINSKFLNWYYQNIINPEKGEALAQVKRGHIAKLPIKLAKKNQISIQTEIIKHVDLLLKLNEEIKEEKLQTKTDQLQQRIEHSEDKINRLVYELYDLSETDIKIIEEQQSTK